jgi:phosphatidate cytidylyltransferase
MLKWRLPVGAALIALLGGLLWLDGRLQGEPAAWAPDGCLPGGAVLAGFSLLTLVPLLAVELTRLLRAGGVRAWPIGASGALAASAFMAVVAHAWDMGRVALAAAMLPLAWLLLPVGQLLRGHADRAVASLGRWMLVAVWIGAMPACWIALRAGVPWVGLVAAVLAVKSNDMGAYFAGRFLGRHRMAPWISPKKTWEGFMGGLVASVGVGAWAGAMCGAGLAAGMAFGIVASVLGPLGDLSESILKRQAEAKDSGRLLPGMGGMFDVMDSLLWTAPAAWWLLGARSA